MQFLRQGLPMIAFMALGSYGLSKLMTGKFISEEARMTEIAAKDNFDLDDELEKMKRELHIDNWENKRIPRPNEQTPGANDKFVKRKEKEK
mmetsp:Transcript_31304/g.76358  ORF Transcript_31304/g.76358 Transcript_31304/m.76358 type:complete len:91 (+) Transcript_31304:427-699(+)|eukprot:CAMPEP_0114515744 /NCGR_PEP_ID=MMETSP0109-20121206/16921_1 /TAXON_ID=29199 /ORGANISM="Chlorarachnion reptans, Strain CCCM449" /LENGTH=90 /DNA_ID=CAMNT_0001696013 /DNA_START=422 /DNA_END=694 /DNA_ORIENTATION=+